jgi:hypothetical protein
MDKVGGRRHHRRGSEDAGHDAHIVEGMVDRATSSLFRHDPERMEVMLENP